MILKINALDTLFFRDGKPFTMGDDSFAQGIFPPPPSVLYGALRSAYLANDMERFSKLKTSQDTSANIQISGIYFLEETRRWDEQTPKKVLFLPMPLDLVKFKNDKNDNTKRGFDSLAFLKEGKDYYSNSKQAYITTFDDNVESAGSAINVQNFNKYLKGEAQNLQVENLFEMIKSEVKIGNALENATRKTDEGKLYRLSMMRFEKVVLEKEQTTLSIIVNTNLDKLDADFDQEKRFLMKLGAEGKTVKAHEIEINLNFPKPTDFGKYFKLYFTTPIIFEKNGWLPDDFDIETGIGTWNGVRLQLLSAFIGKYIPIGGFDLKENKPKKMFKAVPSGSVFYFKVLDETNELTILEKFDRQSLDIDENRQKEGFGWAYVAKLNFSENDN